jgi:uncharacterized membrane protein
MKALCDVMLCGHSYGIHYVVSFGAGTNSLTAARFKTGMINFIVVQEIRLNFVRRQAVCNAIHRRNNEYV